MGRQEIVALHIQRLCELFIPKTNETKGLEAIASMAANRSRWTGAHNLFNEIRRKTLDAHKRCDAAAVVQFEFEEICAKCIHNLGTLSAPFDSDSQYWVIPRAIHFARQLQIKDAAVLRVVIAEKSRKDNFCLNTL